MRHADPHAGLNRRELLRRGGQTLAGVALAQGFSPWALSADEPKLRVAAVLTEFTFRSHAHVILENFLEPYLFNGHWIQPNMQVASLYVDQYPAGEMSRDVAAKYGIKIYDSIDKALCDGGDKLAVDGVLSIGEHGNYPDNAKGQREYPRKQFFDRIAATLERSGRAVPVFNDKHLSYRWDWAKEMYDTSRRLGAPFLAGSSVPLAQRRPPFELPKDAVIRSAVSIHGGGVESYDFHGLEVLQSIVEARRGGEQGVRAVQFFDEPGLWKAADDGLWSIELAEAAMAAELGPGQPPFKELVHSAKIGGRAPHGILVTYRDGFQGMMLTAGSSSTRWNFACNLEGEETPRATSFYVGPWQNRNLFKALSHAIQTHIRQREAPYPVERTLLTTGILDAAMESRYRGNVPLDTPWLDVAYQPRDFTAMREMGASWKIISEEMPEPPGITPGGDGRKM